jgi:hypothetical protein
MVMGSAAQSAHSHSPQGLQRLSVAINGDNPNLRSEETERHCLAYATGRTGYDGHSLGSVLLWFPA